MMQSRMRFDEKHWYRHSLTWAAITLLPASWLFGLVTAVRRWCYRRHIYKSHRFTIPVIVVGNLTVGGTGKTPCVIALANYFRAQGWHPGIVSRGVGGARKVLPLIVQPSSSPDEVGDEALLLVRHSQCPMVISPDRVAAVQVLLQHAPECNLIISDDGLQHYRLARDIEIVVIDGKRQFGNGCLLPAGPLREPVSRLSSVDYIVVNGGVMDYAHTMVLMPHYLVSVSDNHQRLDVDALQAQAVHAVAGIGNPDRFFELLRKHGYHIISHAFPDHHPYTANDLDFGDSLPILMTEKDAVKCESFANHKMWYVDVSAKLDADLLSQIQTKLQGIKS
jgi:tetraacyldisaccharide 4'-kinase